MRSAPDWTPMCVDRSQEYVDAVQADPALRDWSNHRKLAEVMKRSKGSCNPKRVWFLLTGEEPRQGPRSKLPDCRECGEPAYEELQPDDGKVLVTATHKVKCGICPLVDFKPDPRATRMVVRYERGLTEECKVRL